MRSFDVLYEDEELLVVDKPSGLLTVPSPQEPDKTLTRYVNEAFVHQPGRRLFPCHRLDRDTSGAVIFAKSKNGQQLMRRLFERKAIAKKYIAFIRGRLKLQTGQISLPISDFRLMSMSMSLSYLESQFDEPSRAEGSYRDAASRRWDEPPLARPRALGPIGR